MPRSAQQRHLALSQALSTGLWIVLLDLRIHPGSICTCCEGASRQWLLVQNVQVAHEPPHALQIPRIQRLWGGGQDIMRRGSRPMAADSASDEAGRWLGAAGSQPRIVVAGGYVAGVGHEMVTDVVESYHTDKGGWRKEPKLPVVTSGHRVEAVHQNVYVLGGQDSRFLEDGRVGGNMIESTTDDHDKGWPTLDTVWRLDAARGQWTPAPAMFARRACFGSAVIDGRIYAAGGFDGEDFVPGFESYDPREPSWRRLPAFPRPRSAVAMSAVQAGGGAFLVACGGVALPDGICDAVDIFDIRKGAWVQGPPMLGARSGAATVGIQHRLYVMGGTSPQSVLAGVEVLDMHTLQWQRDVSAAMSTPRTSFAAVEYQKTIVAMGGYDENGCPVDVVEIYDPELGWRDGKRLSFARGMMSAAVC
jgi:hypothetical protein